MIKIIDVLVLHLVIGEIGSSIQSLVRTQKNLVDEFLALKKKIYKK